MKTGKNKKRSYSSLGMKFLLAIGLFSTAFSFFMIHQTWKRSHESLQQMLCQQAELAMAFEVALEDAGHHEGANGQTPPAMAASNYRDRMAMIEDVFEKVQKAYPHVLIRASGDQLFKILNQSSEEGDSLYRCFEENPTMESLDRVVKLNGREYLSKFRVERNDISLTDLRSELRMIAIPLEGYRSQINEATIRHSSPLMFALLVLFAAIYISFKLLVSFRLKKITAHFCQAADHDNGIHFLPLQIKSHDEIGLLAESFNSLGQKLQALYSTLDCKVRKRTIALQQANQLLRKKVSQCQQAEEQTQFLAHEASAANRAKNDFLANMSHELRTPMNAIMGFSQVLANEELKEEHQAYVKMIMSSSDNLLSLINDILDYAKIESGKLEIQNNECQIGDLLADVESMLRPDAIEKDVTLEILQCEAVPAMIRTDAMRLRQCLVNLISNALKFTESGHVFVNVSVCRRRDEHFIQFDIEDSGIGIPEKNLPSIFDCFTQVDSTTTRKYGGTGLGLSITRHLAALLRGWVSVVSKEGTGSVFTLAVPLGVKWPDTGAPTWNKYFLIDEMEKLTDTEKGTTMYTGRVLVAEDNPSNQKLIAILLQKLGLEVTIANDGLEAVRECESKIFDIILMDMQMPNMNGYDATRHLRSEGIKTPIIAVTANAMTGDEQKCLDVGCNGYLSKPIDRSKLDELVSQHLAVHAG